MRAEEKTKCDRMTMTQASTYVDRLQHMSPPELVDYAIKLSSVIAQQGQIRYHGQYLPELVASMRRLQAVFIVMRQHHSELSPFLAGPPQ